MGFSTAVSACLSEYASFEGRARRSEYWWFSLFMLLVFIVAAGIGAVIEVPIIFIIAALALLLPSLAGAVRRLHDTDKSGWWLLIGVLPFGNIALLVFHCQDGTPGPNKFGPSPKEAAGAGGY